MYQLQFIFVHNTDGRNCAPVDVHIIRYIHVYRVYIYIYTSIYKYVWKPNKHGRFYISTDDRRISSTLSVASMEGGCLIGCRMEESELLHGPIRQKNCFTTPSFYSVVLQRWRCINITNEKDKHCHQPYTRKRPFPWRNIFFMDGNGAFPFFPMKKAIIWVIQLKVCAIHGCFFGVWVPAMSFVP